MIRPDRMFFHLRLTGAEMTELTIPDRININSDQLMDELIDAKTITGSQTNVTLNYRPSFVHQSLAEISTAAYDAFIENGIEQNVDRRDSFVDTPWAQIEVDTLTALQIL